MGTTAPTNPLILEVSNFCIIFGTRFRLILLNIGSSLGSLFLPFSNMSAFLFVHGFYIVFSMPLAWILDTFASMFVAPNLDFCKHSMYNRFLCFPKIVFFALIVGPSPHHFGTSLASYLHRFAIIVLTFSHVAQVHLRTILIIIIYSYFIPFSPFQSF